jgi:soluble lytic murein transglycosylase-like protein
VRSLALLALAVVLLPAAPASALEPRPTHPAAPASDAAARAMLLAYAAALRAFGGGLAPEQALRLAGRVVAESDAAGLDARLVVALVAVESSWDPRARSPAGARGLGQLMPATAAGLGVDPDDPAANLHGTVTHLAGLLARYRGYPPRERYARALASYNAGAGAVERYGGIPPYRETQLYVRRVIALWNRLSGV